MVHQSCTHITPLPYLKYSPSEYRPQLRAIPTVGGSDLLGLSYLGALRMRGDCRDVLEEGYRKVYLLLRCCMFLAH